MNPSYYRISLDIHEATSQLSFSIKKGDTNRRLIISLMDDGVPYKITGDCYATFSARKPDKQIVFNDCTIKNNLIIYDITKQTTLVEGRLDCEITLFGELGQQITSPRFTIIVYASVYTEEEVESSSEYKSLATLVSEGNQVINEGRELIKDFEESIDDTLSIKGKAADAKVVGEKFPEYQKKTDNGLNTTSKEIVGAINEVNEKVGQGGIGSLTFTDDKNGNVTITASGGTLNFNDDGNGNITLEVA